MFDYFFQRHAGGLPRYYRVEISYNLFGEYSVLREWGAAGGRGRGAQLVVWFSNLREACRAADAWRKRAQYRGYTAASYRGMGA